VVFPDVRRRPRAGVPGRPGSVRLVLRSVRWGPGSAVARLPDRLRLGPCRQGDGAPAASGGQAGAAITTLFFRQYLV